MSHFVNVSSRGAQGVVRKMPLKKLACVSVFCASLVAACSVTVTNSTPYAGGDAGSGLADSASNGDGNSPSVNGDRSRSDASNDTDPNAEWAREARVRELVNAARQRGASCGGTAYPPVAALTFDPLLAQAARLHSADMCVRQFFSHDNPDGKTPFDRMKALGYKYSTAGENIAAGQVTPEDVMQGWMASPGHCQNIMNANFKELGVGYASCNGKFPDYWTQNFGTKQ